MKGVWSWEVYPKAVKYFLENEKWDYVNDKIS
jgi:hypothetical protein